MLRVSSFYVFSLSFLIVKYTLLLLFLFSKGALHISGMFAALPTRFLVSEKGFNYGAGRDKWHLLLFFFSRCCALCARNDGSSVDGVAIPSRVDFAVCSFAVMLLGTFFFFGGADATSRSYKGLS